MPSRRVSAAALFVCLLSTPPAVAQQWIEHRSTTSHFRAEFPGEPTISRTPVKMPYGDAFYGEATVLTDTRIYKVVHLAPPPGAPRQPPETVLAEHVAMAKSMFGGRVLSERDATAETGVMAKMLAVATPESKVAFFMVRTRDQDAYLAIYVCDPSDVRGPEGTRFLSSLRLVPR